MPFGNFALRLMTSAPPKDEDVDYRGYLLEIRRLWIGWRISIIPLAISRHDVDRDRLIAEAKRLVDQHIDPVAQ